jgi:ATP-dependent DNA helicase RecQ
MTLAHAQRALKRFFGYDTFRPMQADIVQSVLNNQDCLVLMPTGGGKSVCFQIPAVISEGVAVVVSPLIALMRDQVDNLQSIGIPAAYLNSSQNAAEQQNIQNALFEQKIKLLYVSPEKMVSAGFVSMLKSLKISLFAIDEAHCISSWGHDFRPEYAQMGFLKTQFPQTPLIALTATADRLTRADIVGRLALRDPQIFISSFDRPNLSLDVRPAQKRFEQIEDFLKRKTPRDAGIVYCLSRKTTEQIAEKLRAQGYRAEAYHAQLPHAVRARVQDEFLKDKIQIVCATIAFGMGIDKPNVRWVVHYNLPKNIESYYQEIGRAGRDGAAAETLLFYSFQDVQTYHDMFEQVDAANKEIQQAKLDRMMKFADAQMCRRKILLAYFNEYLEENCGNCDICRNPPLYIDGTKTTQIALSAVSRLKSECQASVNMSMLTDILRGSARQEIVSAGFDKIKTYGAGRGFSPAEWSSYLWQLIQMGYLEIAYEDYHRLRLTTSSRHVLFENQPVKLLKPISFQERKAEQERQEKLVSELLKQEREPRLRARNILFEALRQLRDGLAHEQGMALYMVFSNQTLEEMAAQMPTSETELRQISGVGEKKMEVYGDVFLKEIREFLADNPEFAATKPEPKSSVPAFFDKKPSLKVAKVVKEKPKEKAKEKEPKISSQYQTYALYQKGFTLWEVAEQREISQSTVRAHLLYCLERGEELREEELVSAAETTEILEAARKFGSDFRLRDIFEHLREEISYDKIRFALAFEKQRNKDNI